MITVIDYHLNNLRSIHNTLSRLGHDARITSDPKDVETADKLILPGVGAFPDAMGNLQDLGLAQPIIEKVSGGTPMLGICLGMHLLFDKSEEFGENKGLGLIKGVIRRLPDGVHIPHMGWNQLHHRRGDRILDGVVEGSFVYFVHSYCASIDDGDAVIAVTDYGINFPSVVGSGNVWATQFHPEKSQSVGERILDNFLRL